MNFINSLIADQIQKLRKQTNKLKSPKTAANVSKIQPTTRSTPYNTNINYINSIIIKHIQKIKKQIKVNFMRKKTSKPQQTSTSSSYNTTIKFLCFEGNSSFLNSFIAEHIEKLREQIARIPLVPPIPDHRTQG